MKAKKKKILVGFLGMATAVALVIGGTTTFFAVESETSSIVASSAISGEESTSSETISSEIVSAIPESTSSESVSSETSSAIPESTSTASDSVSAAQSISEEENDDSIVDQPEPVELLDSAIVDQGTYNGITWELDDAGVLTFTSGGTFPALNITESYQTYSSMPIFRQYENEITKIVFTETIKLDRVAYNVFAGMPNLVAIENFNILDVSACQYAPSWFVSDTSLKSIDLSGMIFTNATNTKGFFEDCTSLEEINFSGTKMPRLLAITEMFKNCTSLTSIDLSSLQPEKLGYEAQSVFIGCTALKEMNLTNFKLSASGIDYFFPGPALEKLIMTTPISGPTTYGLAMPSYPQIWGDWARESDGELVKDIYFSTKNSDFVAGTYIRQPAKAPVITTESLPYTTVGATYEYQMKATGVPSTMTWTLLGDAGSAGFKIDSKTGVISGASSKIGTYTAQITASNGVNPSATKFLKIIVGEAPTITTTGLPFGIVGEEYSSTLQATGYPSDTMTWSVVKNSLPKGLSLNTSTGEISGTPTENGTFYLTFQADNGISPAAKVDITLRIYLLPTITNDVLPDGEVGVNYRTYGEAIADPKATGWSCYGDVPPGLSMAAYTGEFAGRPTQAGVYTFYFTTSNMGGHTSEKEVTITIYGSPVITTSSLPDGLLDNSYSQTLVASGYPTEMDWSLVDGALPDGLTLNSATGEIAGTTTKTGTYTFTVQADNGSSKTGQKEFTISVNAAPTITTENLPDGKTQATYSETLAATSFPTAVKWSVTDGTLPDGLALNTTTGEISGTPTKVGTFTFTVQADNGIEPKATKELSITINEAPTITTETLPDGTTQSNYSEILVATGTPTEMEWSLTDGALPDGLALNPTSGEISGTPTKVGTFTFTVQADNGIEPKAVRELSITIYAGPVITTETLADGKTKATYSETITATGTPAEMTWSVTDGTLPNGLALDATTGKISGTPTKVGTFTFTVQADNGVEPKATKQFSITIYEAPVITTETLADGKTKVTYSETLLATGTPSEMKWSLTDGALPDGLALNETTGEISGTPTKVGTFTFTVGADNGIEPKAEKELSITIYEAPVITTETLPDGKTKATYSETITATGTPAEMTWSLPDGTLPDGLALSATTGKISGTPTKVGTFTFTIQADNGVEPKATKQFSITINEAPVITTESLPNGATETVYSEILTAIGTPSDMTWSIVSGALPDGLTLNATTGEISGTPTKVGVFTFTVQADNGIDPKAQKEFSISTNNAPSITTDSLADGVTNIAYSQTLAAVGAPSTMTWDIIGGALPDGLALNATTGEISGTPTQVGAFTFTAQADNGVEPKAAKEFSITIYEAPVITTETLPDGTTKAAYSTTLVATGTPSTITWSVVNGALPDGLSLDATTGEISGTPTKAGTFVFTVQAENGIEPKAEKMLSIKVYDAPTITTESLSIGFVGISYTQELEAKGTPENFVWSITSGTLPSGLSLDSDSGTIAGMPIQIGTYVVTIKVSNGIVPDAEKKYSITIFDDEYYTNSLTEQVAIQANTFAAYASEVNTLSNDSYIERSNLDTWSWSEDGTNSEILADAITIDKSQVKAEKGVYPVKYTINDYSEGAVTAFVVVSDGDAVNIDTNPREAIQASDFIISAQQVQNLATDSALRDKAYRDLGLVSTWTWDNSGVTQDLSNDTVTVDVSAVQAVAGTYPVTYTTQNGTTVTAYATVQTKDEIKVDKQTKEVIQASTFEIKQYLVDGLQENDYINSSLAQAWSINVESNTLNQEVDVVAADFSQIVAQEGNYPVIYKTEKGTSVTAYVKVIANDVKLIRFDGNGADIQANPSSMSIIEPGQKLNSLPSDPARTGYTFDGWALSATATQKDIDLNTLFAEDTTVYAVWSVNNYEVSFDAKGGGTNPTNQTIQYNTLIKKPEVTLTKKGHSFVGWFTQPTGGTYWNFATKTMPAQDITLYAQYEANKYEVVFVPNNNQDRTVASVAYDTKVPVPIQPKLYGYTFLGWYDQSGKLWDFENTTMPDCDIVLSAKWEHTKYQLTYVTYDLKEISNYTLYAGDQIPIEASPYVGGHHFAGWVESGTDNHWNFYNGMPDRNLQLVAVYDKNIPDESSIASQSSKDTSLVQSSVSSKVNESVVLTSEVSEVVPKSDSNTNISQFGDVKESGLQSFSSGDVPLSNVQKASTWSLLSLIASIVGALVSLISLFVFFKNRNKITSKATILITTVLGIVLFLICIVTTDFSGIRVFFEPSSWIYIISVILQVILLIVGLRSKNREDDELEENENM